MKIFSRILILFLALTAVSCSSGSPSYSSLIEEADVIFVGRVDYISITDADDNQKMALTVIESIMDKSNLGSGVVLTIDLQSAYTADDFGTAIATSELAVGDEIIVFAHEVSSRDSQTAVLMPIANGKSPFVAVRARNEIISQAAR